jgi:hypothetical protein
MTHMVRQSPVRSDVRHCLITVVIRTGGAAVLLDANVCALEGAARRHLGPALRLAGNRVLS